MMTTTTTTPATALDPTTPSIPAPGVPPWKVLSRMPLVWVAVLVPAAFLFYLFFLTPPL